MSKSKSRIAGVIDIGSGSIRLVIGQKSGKTVSILEMLENVVQLGKDTFDSGKITQSTINETINILLKYKNVLESYEVDNIRVIATTAVREAENRDVFVDTLKLKTGFSIEVFPVGDTVFYIDSYLYYNLQDRYPVHDKNLLIAEMGAGTLDISVMTNGFMVMSIGLPLGLLKLKQLASSLSGTQEETQTGILDYIETELVSISRYMPDIHIDDIIIIDENFTSYLEYILPDTRWEKTFFAFSRDNAEILFDKILHVTPDELVRDFSMPRNLAEEADMTALILDGFFSHFKKEKIYIIETSLHYALLMNILFGYGLPKRRNIIEHLMSFVETLGSRFTIDKKHAHHVSFLAKILFNALRKQMGLAKKFLSYLLIAAFLHDIGKFISNRAHHKHSLYIINTLNLFRMSDQEISIIGNIARYHRKSSPVSRHAQYQYLNPNHQILVQKLSAILRIADALDRSHKQKIKKIEVSDQDNSLIRITAFCEDPVPLEKMAFERKKEQFEDITGTGISLMVKEAWMKD